MSQGRAHHEETDPPARAPHLFPADINSVYMPSCGHSIYAQFVAECYLDRLSHMLFEHFI